MSAPAPPSTSEQVQVYGLDASQPCRSVTWLLRMHDIPFKYIFIQPGYEKTQTKTTSEICKCYYVCKFGWCDCRCRSKKEGGSRHPDFLKKNPMGQVREELMLP